MCPPIAAQKRPERGAAKEFYVSGAAYPSISQTTPTPAKAAANPAVRTWLSGRVRTRAIIRFIGPGNSA